MRHRRAPADPRPVTNGGPGLRQSDERLRVRLREISVVARSVDKGLTMAATRRLPTVAYRQSSSDTTGRSPNAGFHPSTGEPDPGARRDRDRHVRRLPGSCRRCRARGSRALPPTGRPAPAVTALVADARAAHDRHDTRMLLAIRTRLAARVGRRCRPPGQRQPSRRRSRTSPPPRPPTTRWPAHALSRSCARSRGQPDKRLRAAARPALTN